MAPITGFSYTLVKQRLVDASPSVKEETYTLAAGNGSLTYPTGGIALVNASLGCPNFLESVVFAGETSPAGYVYKFNKTTGNIQLFQVPTSGGGVLIEAPSTATPNISFDIIAKGY